MAWQSCNSLWIFPWYVVEVPIKFFYERTRLLAVVSGADDAMHANRNFVDFHVDASKLLAGSAVNLISNWVLAWGMSTDGSTSPCSCFRILTILDASVGLVLMWGFVIRWITFGTDKVFGVETAQQIFSGSYCDELSGTSLDLTEVRALLAAAFGGHQPSSTPQEGLLEAGSTAEWLVLAVGEVKRQLLKDAAEVDRAELSNGLKPLHDSSKVVRDIFVKHGWDQKLNEFTTVPNLIALRWQLVLKHPQATLLRGYLAQVSSWLLVVLCTKAKMGVLLLLLPPGVLLAVTSWTNLPFESRASLAVATLLGSVQLWVQDALLLRAKEWHGRPKATRLDKALHTALSAAYARGKQAVVYVSQGMCLAETAQEQQRRERAEEAKAAVPSNEEARRPEQERMQGEGAASAGSHLPPEHMCKEASEVQSVKHPIEVLLDTLNDWLESESSAGTAGNLREPLLSRSQSGARRPRGSPGCLESVGRSIGKLKKRWWGPRALKKIQVLTFGGCMGAALMLVCLTTSDPGCRTYGDVRGDLGTALQDIYSAHSDLSRGCRRSRVRETFRDRPYTLPLFEQAATGNYFRFSNGAAIVSRHWGSSSGNFSLALRVRAAGACVSTCGLVDTRATDRRGGFGLLLANGSLRLELGPGGSAGVISAGRLSKREWHSVVVVLHLGGEEVYVDGSLGGVRAGLALPFAEEAASEVVMGGTALGLAEQVPTGWFDGDLADVRMYGRALTAEDVASFTSQEEPPLCPMVLPRPLYEFLARLSFACFGMGFSGSLVRHYEVLAERAAARWFWAFGLLRWPLSFVDTYANGPYFPFGDRLCEFVHMAGPPPPMLHFSSHSSHLKMLEVDAQVEARTLLWMPTLLVKACLLPATCRLQWSFFIEVLPAIKRRRGWSTNKVQHWSPRTMRRVFAQYHLAHNFFLYALMEICVTHGFVHVALGLDWEFWLTWMDWLLLFLNATALLKYWANSGTRLRTSTADILMLLAPGFGNDIHLAKDWIFVGLCFQMAYWCQSTLAAFLAYFLAVASLISIFLPMPELLGKEADAASYISSHWPILLASPVGDAEFREDRLEQDWSPGWRAEVRQQLQRFGIFTNDPKFGSFVSVADDDEQTVPKEALEEGEGDEKEAVHRRDLLDDVLREHNTETDEENMNFFVTDRAGQRTSVSKASEANAEGLFPLTVHFPAQTFPLHIRVYADVTKHSPGTFMERLQTWLLDKGNAQCTEAKQVVAEQNELPQALFEGVFAVSFSASAFIIVAIVVSLVKVSSIPIWRGFVVKYIQFHGNANSLVEYVRAHGDKPEWAGGSRALHLAAGGGQLLEGGVTNNRLTDAVPLLLSECPIVKEKLNHANDAGMTPLMNAARFAEPTVFMKVCLRLVEASAEPQTQVLDLLSQRLEESRGEDAKHQWEDCRVLASGLKEYYYHSPGRGEERSPLLWAVTQGDMDLFKLVLKAGAVIQPNEVAVEKFNGRTPLHFAVEGGNKDIIKHLLRFSASLSAVDANKRNVVHEAALTGCPREACRALLASARTQRIFEELLSAQDSGGATPMHRAVERGSLETCEAMAREVHSAGRCQLLQVKDGEGQTPLHWAATDLRAGLETSIKICKLLVHFEADLTACDNCEKTPLDLAWGHGGSSELSEALVNQPFEPTADPPLACAVKGERKRLFNFLLQNKADVDGRKLDPQGLTTLHHAATNPDVYYVEELLRHGADASAQHSSTGETALDRAALAGLTAPCRAICKAMASHARSQHILASLQVVVSSRQAQESSTPRAQLCKFLCGVLLEHSGDINESLPWRSEPTAAPQPLLHKAVQLVSSSDDAQDVCKALVEKGRFDLTVRSSVGQTALDIAEGDVHHALVHRWSPKEGVPPVIAAAESAHIALVGLLLEHRADPEARDARTSRTLLHVLCAKAADWAMPQEAIAMVSDLLDARAQADSLDLGQRTPLQAHLVAGGTSVELCKELLSTSKELSEAFASKVPQTPLQQLVAAVSAAALSDNKQACCVEICKLLVSKDFGLLLCLREPVFERSDLDWLKRAVINASDWRGVPALHRLAAASQEEVRNYEGLADALIRHGAEINQELGPESLQGHLPWTPQRALTPLLVAARAGHESVCKSLVTAKAAIDPVVLDYARESASASTSAYMQEVVLPALHRAAKDGSVDGVVSRIPLEEKAPFTDPDPVLGQIPLHYAAAEGHDFACTLLIREFNVKRSHSWFFYTSTLYADLLAKNKQGRTPLHLAARAGKAGACKAILEALHGQYEWPGVRRKVLLQSDGDGQSALAVATLGGQHQVCRYLERVHLDQSQDCPVAEHCCRVVLPRDQHGLEVDRETLRIIKVHPSGERGGESSARKWNQLAHNIIEDGSFVFWCNTHRHDTASGKLFSQFHDDYVDTLIMDILLPEAAERLRSGALERLNEKAAEPGSKELAICITEAQDLNSRFKLQIPLTEFESERARRSKLEQDLSNAVDQKGSAELREVLKTAMKPTSLVHWEEEEKVCTRREEEEKEIRKAREELGSEALRKAIGKVKENIRTDGAERECLERERVQQALYAAKDAVGSDGLDKAISEAIDVGVHSLDAFVARAVGVEVHSFREGVVPWGEAHLDEAILEAAGDKGVKVRLRTFFMERETRRAAEEALRVAANEGDGDHLDAAVKACHARVDLLPFQKLCDKLHQSEMALEHGFEDSGSEKLRRAIDDAGQVKIKDLDKYKRECTRREEAEAKLRSARGSAELDAVIKEVERSEVRVRLESWKSRCAWRRKAEEHAKMKLQDACNTSGSGRLREALAAVQKEGIHLDNWDVLNDLCMKRKRAEDTLDEAVRSPSSAALDQAIQAVKASGVNVDWQSYKEAKERKQLEQSPPAPYMVVEPVCVRQQPEEASSGVSGFLPRGSRLMVTSTKETAAERCVHGYVLRDPDLGIVSGGWVKLRKTSSPYTCWVSPLTAAGRPTPPAMVDKVSSVAGTPYFSAWMTEEEAMGLAANRPDISGFYHEGSRTNLRVRVTLFREEPRLVWHWTVRPRNTAFTIRR